MKKYKFELVVSEGYDETWEELEKSGRTGCDDVLAMVIEMLNDNPQINATVKLIEFTDKE